MMLHIHGIMLTGANANRTIRSMPVKITGIDIEIHTPTKRENPPRDALQTLSGGGSLTVTVTTDDGVTGTGAVSFGRVSGASKALGVFVEEVLKPVVIGEDPWFVRSIHRSMLAETEYHGSFGFAMFGIAAIDVAIWDCVGRAAGQPCWKLWGGMNRTIRAYAMVGWMNHTDDELAAICRTAVDQGFRTVKMKVGYPTLSEDIRRVELVRDALGDGIGIAVDANQSLTTPEAIRRGRAFEEMGCLWWEEPIAADDIDGYRQLAQALDIPVATGENLYTPSEFARFLRTDAVDIVQPDLRRAGGATALLQIGALSDSFRVPYASHGGGPVQLSVMAALPNAYYLETGLIGDDSPLTLEEGFVAIPDGPGFSWLQKAST